MSSKELHIVFGVVFNRWSLEQLLGGGGGGVLLGVVVELCSQCRWWCCVLVG